MSRSYSPNALKKNRVYSIQDLVRIYNVSANTVTNWTKHDLRKSDKQQPHLFRGAIVNAFHKQRRLRSKTKLRRGEFKCTGCKLAVFVEIETLEERIVGKGANMCFGRCPECGAHVQKITSQADRDFFEALRNPNTTVDSLHEAIYEDLGGVGKVEEIYPPSVWTANDRLIYNWQNYAGRYDEKTVDRHLSAIRLMEEILGGKPFDQLTNNDVGLVREELKKSLLAVNELQRSKSTVAHTASHLTAFLDWLLKQDGYKRLPRDLPDYLKLPKSVYSASLDKKKRAYPTLDEAETLLRGMPVRSLKDQRSKAIFAMAFLGGLRADTLASLRICHFDPVKKLIIQDASIVRTKNGKSLNINWFPIPKIFGDVVTEWVSCLEALGFAGLDALFPSEAILTSREHLDRNQRDPIIPTGTKHVVTEAFKAACRNIDVKYTPHSARHTLAAERDARPLTHEQRKGWSEAMGHEKEQTTDVHYGRLTDERRTELFRQISEGKSATITDLSDEAKIQIIDMVLEKI
ncbi:tyrosine-type recombinase/integrase [Pacificibacter marinus]|uniref:tyrosine-type recombinase/integrase n=1 Tax=Pacificibacter marinus TaxID=658057 RepID=UPI001C067910|nr:site-specific integrase [Pacificibacter marinus]MBU2868671.1 site-specific integrase [Pacificibacter marinus]